MAFALAGCGGSTKSYTVGGTITGLAGSGLEVDCAGLGTVKVLAGEPRFTFGTRADNGFAYAVTVGALPGGQRCTVSRGTGVVRDADVADVAVTCAAGGATWSGAGSFARPRSYFAAELLPSGSVLLAGGQSDEPAWGEASAELFEPGARAWSRASPMGAKRDLPCSAVLPSGKLLVAGGANEVSGCLASAELYDPAADAWAATGSMAVARAVAACVLLPSGKVLVTGGSDCRAATATAELYDPGTGLFTATGSMATARWNHTATLLASGRVLVAGGCAGAEPCTASTASAELYDPTTGLWTGAGSMPNAVVAHTATMLASGKVLVAGGCLNYRGPGSCADLDRDRRASLYDPAAGTWSATAPLPRGRVDHAALLLGTGEVLLVGGGYWSGAGTRTALYDPAAGTWGPGWSTATDHGGGARAVKLPGGRWLVAGGALPTSPQTNTGAAEILAE